MEEVTDTVEPMEGHIPQLPLVSTTEGVPTVANQPETDPLTGTFSWELTGFTKLKDKKQYSDAFMIGGHKWRVLIFPRGNNVDFLSIYLDVPETNQLPVGWTRYAHFTLSIVNQIDSKLTIKKDTQHQFNARESDWGFTSFMPLGDLFDSSRGFVVNDKIIINAEVNVRFDYWAYDSKKETGFVGLKNQGATCYMNSLLQTLYHIPYFRKAVYHMPTTADDVPSSSIPLALQSLFYKVQYSDQSVATKDLTKSFGWDTYDSFMQHDVQELNRVLCEKLEDKMKGTAVEGTIQRLFEGHVLNYIDCINVDYKSTRKESYYGRVQDARKGVSFLDFPPVLQLQLKRFEYDFARDTMVKVNDRYEFPLELDLDRENGKYLAFDADRSVRNFVLVHSGGVHGGHYYAFIRPTLSNNWYKFDDERVTKEDTKRALEEQYGGEEELPQTNPGFNNAPFKFTKYSNAYMLVYIRQSDKDKIVCNVDEKDIAEHLQVRLKKEQEEKERKRKEKAEAHLYTVIKVTPPQAVSFEANIGNDIHFDLVDHEKVQTFRIQKQMPFIAFKEVVAKELGIPTDCQRYWLWAKRQNHTYRPNRPLTPVEEQQTVGQLREASSKEKPVPVPPPERAKDEILLFFKLYDAHKEELRYLGRMFVKYSCKPADLKPKICKMAGFAPTEELLMFEGDFERGGKEVPRAHMHEIKFEPNVMCEPIDKKLTLKASQLEDGDIICCQKVVSDERVRYPTVPQYLEYVRNRQIVRFRRLEKFKDDEFSLELSKQHTYDDVVDRLAAQLGLDDPSKLRLTQHNCYSQQPKPPPVKYRGVDRLSDMLVHYNLTSDILYFEVQLSRPSAELRILEVFPRSEVIENINDQYWTLRAEEVPAEEEEMGPQDRLIHVYHFTRDTSQNPMVHNFGDPFYMVVLESETLAEVKERIKAKLEVPDDEFAKWRFAFLSLGRPEYLQDSDVVASRFQKRDTYGAWEHYLGLEHTDTAPKRSHQSNQNRHSYEKPVKIYN
eukprot:jgi/Mesen1/6165/ME000317S05299